MKKASFYKLAFLPQIYHELNLLTLRMDNKYKLQLLITNNKSNKRMLYKITDVPYSYISEIHVLIVYFLSFTFHLIDKI